MKYIVIQGGLLWLKDVKGGPGLYALLFCLYACYTHFTQVGCKCLFPIGLEYLYKLIWVELNLDFLSMHDEVVTPQVRARGGGGGE